MWFAAASTRRWKLIFAMRPSTYPWASLHVILGPVISSPPTLYEFFKVFFHKGELLLQFLLLILGPRPLSYLIIPFFFKWLYESMLTISPFLGGETTSSPFQARSALEAASWTWMIRLRDACTKAYCTFKSIILSFSLEGRSNPSRSIILHTCTLH